MADGRVVKMLIREELKNSDHETELTGRDDGRRVLIENKGHLAAAVWRTDWSDPRNAPHRPQTR